MSSLFFFCITPIVIYYFGASYGFFLVKLFYFYKASPKASGQAGEEVLSNKPRCTSRCIFVVYLNITAVFFIDVCFWTGEGGRKD